MDTWSGLSEWSWCTTRVCDGSVAAVAALSESYGAGGAEFTVTGATLALDPPGAPPSDAVTPVGPRRIHPARLRYSRWRPAVRVTVEVDPWTESSSEVVVRPRRRLPSGRDAYFRGALATLAALAAEVDRDRLDADSVGRTPMAPLRWAS